MKRKFGFAIVAIVITCGFTACSDDNPCRYTTDAGTVVDTCPKATTTTVTQSVFATTTSATTTSATTTTPTTTSPTTTQETVIVPGVTITVPNIPTTTTTATARPTVVAIPTLSVGTTVRDCGAQILPGNPFTYDALAISLSDDRRVISFNQVPPRALNIQALTVQTSDLSYPAGYVTAFSQNLVGTGSGQSMAFSIAVDDIVAAAVCLGP